MKQVKNNHLPQSNRTNKPTSESPNSLTNHPTPEPGAFRRLLAQYKAKVYEKYASAF